jgi:endonuclease YncB( thermonuclease family)
LRLGQGQPLTGHAAVIDGDSLRLNGQELRLEGIDAPELRQNCTDSQGRTVGCGRLARQALIRLVGQAPLTCDVGRTDRYGRGLARCRGNGLEINAAMVEAGHAVAYGAYGREEERARAAGRGLWALQFERPELWRRAHPR